MSGFAAKWIDAPTASSALVAGAENTEEGRLSKLTRSPRSRACMVTVWPLMVATMFAKLCADLDLRIGPACGVAGGDACDSADLTTFSTVVSASPPSARASDSIDRSPVSDPSCFNRMRLKSCVMNRTAAMTSAMVKSVETTADAATAPGVSGAGAAAIAASAALADAAAAAARR